MATLGRLPLELRGRQLALYRALAERSEELAGWYLGARMALADPANPERFVHAAHSIRELIDKLNSVLNVPAKVIGGRLGDQVAKMAEEWERAKASSDCHQDGTWSGEIDNAHRRGIRAVEALIEWRASERPQRTEVFRATLRAIDVSGRTLPPQIEDAFVGVWDELRNFFVKVSHHGSQPTEVEFLRALDTFETFVIDRLKPRTFAEQAELDRIIEEAEGAA
jgi:hypothetical protein